MKFEDIKKTLVHNTVGIAGCGGLGSNAAVALARTGIGKLIIADHDIIEQGNLNRQFYFYNQVGRKKVFTLLENISLVNPDVKVEPHDVKLSPEITTVIFKDCDVIIEAFDLAKMKQMIIETVLDKMKGKPLVVGIGLAGYGKSNSIRLRNEGNLYVCGDGISETSENNPPLAPRVGIVANMQANQVLEILLNNNY